MRRYIAILFLLLPAMVGAQDIHFSQFYNSPLTLNPTLTGLMEGKARVGVIYRNQWNSVSTPFSTVSAGFDMPIHKGFSDNDLMGAGLVVYYDKAGSAGLSTLNVSGSFAYHKSLSKKGQHLLSLGVQVGFIQKRVDPNAGVFADQVDNTLTINPVSAEQQNIKNVLHEELNIGLSYSGKLGKRSNLYLGGSVFHVTQPKESFYGDGDTRLPMRYVGNLGVKIGLGKRFSLLPSAIYMMQAKTSELNLGMGIGYEAENTFTATVGVYYRLEDAVIPMLAMGYKGVTLSASYDINISGLNEVSNSRGGFELSLNYILLDKKTPYKYPVFFAPRF